MSQAVTVLLVDDQPLLRMGFSMILDAEEGIEVVGEAGDGAAALTQVQALSPAVVLMDVRMPGMDGIEATQRILEAHPDTRIIVLTTFDLDEYAFAALRAGASGFLLKDVRPHALVAAIRSVAAGDAAISPRVTRRMLELFSPALPAEGKETESAARAASLLTPRELEVLRAMTEGLTNQEIAERFVVSETTIKTHVGNVFAKLGLRDRVQAVIYAYESGLVRPGA
jgi:DNA-binding NarL/FixJ family response regulator